MDDVRGLNFINGEYRLGSSGRTFDNISPVDGSLIGVVHEASEADVNDAVMAARAALSGPWGTMALAERLKIVCALVDGIQRKISCRVVDGNGANRLDHLFSRPICQADGEGEVLVISGFRFGALNRVTDSLRK